jgi:hypothetical protein
MDAQKLRQEATEEISGNNWARPSKIAAPTMYHIGYFNVHNAP